MTLASPMRFRPPNPNPSLPNLCTLYLACMGGGKSQAVYQNPDIPARGARVVLWDQSGDHPGLHYVSKHKFVHALQKGIEGGKGFRVAYAGPASVEDYEWWISVLWRVLDGRYLTYAIAEELAEVCPSAGRATPNAGILLNQGRKYGLRFHGTSQRPQEVAKTYYTNCPIKFVGQQLGIDMQTKMAREIGLQRADIAALDQLQFYRHDGTAARPELLKLKYKAKPAGAVRWPDAA